MTRTCPCCGQAVETDPLEAARAALSPMQRKVLEAVIRCPGISAVEIADLVYADHPDGGPLTAEIAVRTFAFYANRRLKAFGFRMRAKGSGTNGYRLERLP